VADILYRLITIISRISKNQHLIFSENDSNIQKLYNKRRIWLDGDFQNPKFFIESISELKLIFRLTEIEETYLDRLIAEARKNQKKIIGIHVRRGDNVLQQHLGTQVLSSDYYRAAYDFSSRDMSEGLVFTDDEHWCRDDTFLRTLTVISGIDDVMQWRLFTRCDEFILSGSTFGWWAAFLSHSNLVIAPKPFFGARYEERDLGLIPNFWKQIKDPIEK
jgi:hypothetical protein